MKNMMRCAHSDAWFDTRPDPEGEEIVDPIGLRSFQDLEWPVQIRDDATPNHYYEMDELLNLILLRQSERRAARNPLNPQQILRLSGIDPISWPGHDAHRRLQERTQQMSRLVARTCIIERMGGEARAAQRFAAVLTPDMLRYHRALYDMDVEFDYTFEALQRLVEALLRPQLHNSHRNVPRMIVSELVRMCDNDPNGMPVIYDPDGRRFFFNPRPETRLLFHPPTSG